MSIAIDRMDMAEGTLWGIYDDHLQEVYEPIVARLADYATTLDIFE